MARRYREYHGASRVIRSTWLTLQLAGELLADPKTPNVRLILCDIVEPKPPKGAKQVICRKADLCDPAEINALFNTEFGVPDTIYCFHGIMSRGSEDNFDLGLSVSLAQLPLVAGSAISRS